MDLQMATVRVYTERAALEGLVPQWGQLAERTIGATVYQTPEWVLAWLHALGKHSVPFGVALFEGERLVGFAPLGIDTVWGVRVVRFMGGELNDFNCLLAEPAYVSHFSALVARTLAEHPEKWDVLCLTGLDGKESLGQQIRAEPATGARLHKLRPGDLPTIALPDSWERYQARLSGHRRKRFRQSQRLLQAHGQVTFQVLTEPLGLAEALAIFFEARMENWRARKRLHRMVAVQHTHEYWSTLTNICLDLAAQGRVWLGRLDVDGVPVGWDLGFVMNGIVTDYMTTYDVRYGHSSPGHLVTREMICHAIEQGMRCFVLGRGAQAYKYWLGAAPRVTENILIFANRPRGHAYVGIQVLRDHALEVARGLYGHITK